MAPSFASAWLQPHKATVGAPRGVPSEGGGLRPVPAALRKWPRAGVSTAPVSRSPCLRCAASRGEGEREPLPITSKSWTPSTKFGGSGTNGPVPVPVLVDSGLEIRDTWEQLGLLERSIEVAVQAEDYKTAADARDRRDTLLKDLSPSSQILLSSAGHLISGSKDEQVQAAKTLGELGDPRALHFLRDALLLPGNDLCETVEGAMWKLFWHSGEADVDALMAEGRELMMSASVDIKSAEAAVKLFTTVIEKRPDFAEGWNQRATALYLMGQNRKSIRDCESVISLMPYHFGALSGMGLCYTKLGDMRGALEWFERALSVNPHMAQIQQYSERVRGLLHDEESERRQGEGWQREGGDSGEAEKE